MQRNQEYLEFLLDHENGILPFIKKNFYFQNKFHRLNLRIVYTCSGLKFCLLVSLIVFVLVVAVFIVSNNLKINKAYLDMTI